MKPRASELAGCTAQGELFRRSRERGVVIVIALIVLAAMMLAGVALVRSMDTGNQISGNFAFRQAAVQATDAGIEGAFTDLTKLIITDKNGDTTTQSWYYPKITTLMGTAESKDADFFDTVKVENSKYKSLTAKSVSGNDVSYLVERLCTATIAGGTPEADADGDTIVSDQEIMNACAHESSREGCSYSTEADCKPRLKSIFFKATVKVGGPRNTSSLAQSTLSFPPY
jgi:type IV pilus assembly protein PilX